MQRPVATKYFAVSISWLQIKQSSFATRFFVSFGDGTGSSASPASPTLVIAGLSAWRPRPNRTSIEARASLAPPGRLSVVRRIGCRSADWARHRDSALRTDDEPDKAFLTTHHSDNGRYSDSEICRTCKRPTTTSPLPLRTGILADWHALDHPIRLRQLARPHLGATPEIVRAPLAQRRNRAQSRSRWLASPGYRKKFWARGGTHLFLDK